LLTPVVADVIPLFWVASPVRISENSSQKSVSHNNEQTIHPIARAITICHLCGRQIGQTLSDDCHVYEDTLEKELKLDLQRTSVENTRLQCAIELMAALLPESW